MFKNCPSICYIFFAINDVIVMSVNTYMSVIGYMSLKIFAKDLIKYVSSVLNTRAVELTR